MYIQSVIEGLDLGNGQFLLAVAWATESAIRFHELYPSIMGVDVVFGTNREKRPHMRGSGKSADNKNLPYFNAFLPSQQKWVFDWIMSDAIPSLFNREALKLTTIILSDQDKNLCDAIDKAIISEDRIYGHAKRRGCKWHKVRLFNFVAYRAQNWHLTAQACALDIVAQCAHKSFL